MITKMQQSGQQLSEQCNVRIVTETTANYLELSSKVEDLFSTRFARW